MAKSARASSRKKNNTALRAKIFDPALDARTERLSAKLQELAAKPRPDRQRAMEVDEPQDNQNEQVEDGAMDVDAEGAEMKPVAKLTSNKKRSGRIEKRATKRRSKNSIVFAYVKAKWRKQKEQRQKRNKR